MDVTQKLSLLCNSRGLQIPFVPNLFLDFRRMALLICFTAMVIGKKVANAFQCVSGLRDIYLSGKDLVALLSVCKH